MRTIIIKTDRNISDKAVLQELKRLRKENVELKETVKLQNKALDYGVWDICNKYRMGINQKELKEFYLTFADALLRDEEEKNKKI